jgi:uncharacterized protein with ParB-like and HNH nuclease domain
MVIGVEKMSDNNKKLNTYDFKLGTISFGEINLLNSMDILDLNHPTQRNHVWSLEDATKFIESIIQKFPFEPIYIIKNKTYYSVIDGKQRISALLLFLGLLKDEDIKNDLKKTDDQIKSNFELDFNFLSNEIKAAYEIAADDRISFEYLKSKIPNLSQLIAELRFPLYLSNQEKKKRGSENNVYELFVKLNSTGIGIESGELIKATLLEKYQKAFIQIEKSITEFADCVSTKKLPRERIWYLFSLLWLMYTYEKDNKFSESFNSISNLDDMIISFIKEETKKNSIDEFISKLDCANIIVREYIEENSKSLFNQNGSRNSMPINFYVYSIYSYLFWYPDEKEDLETFKNEVAALASSKDKYVYKKRDDDEDDEIILKIYKKYSREPQKIRLGIEFAKLFSENKNKDDYEELIGNMLT